MSDLAMGFSTTGSRGGSEKLSTRTRRSRARLLAHPFLVWRPPKSPDRRDFPALSAEPTPAEDGAATLLALAAKGMACTTSSRRRPSSDCLRAGEHDARGSHRRSADRDRVPTHAMGSSADLWRRRPSPISRAPGQEAALELPGTTSVRQPVTGARPAPLALRPLILSSSSCPTACGDRRRSPP
jgi:hypothetical protein